MHSGLSDRPALPRTHVAIHYKKKKKVALLHYYISGHSKNPAVRTFAPQNKRLDRSIGARDRDRCVGTSHRFRQLWSMLLYVFYSFSVLLLHQLLTSTTI